MKYLLMIPRALWKLWFLLNFLVSLLLLYPVFVVLLSREAWFPACFRILHFWALWLLYPAGLFPSVKYAIKKRHIPSPCIYVANHTSYLDIIFSHICIPHYFIFVGKQELDKAPLFRIFFKRMNILVNRKSNVDSHRAFLESGRRLEKGQSVFIFPEATISSSGNMIPFKNGAFKLAIDKQVPIVPIVFFENWKHLQNGGFFTSHGRPGKLRAVVLDVVETKGMTNADLLPLRERVRKLMHDALEKDKHSHANH